MRDLQSQFEVGSAAWPGVTLDAKRFNTLWHERSTMLPTPDATEVYIAAACSESPHAITALEKRYFPPLEQRLRAMRMSPSDIDDVLAQVRERLLCPTIADASPKLRQYAGAGKFEGLVMVTGYRIAVSLLRTQSRSPIDDDVLLSIPAAATDPEIAAIRRQFKEEFQTAFSAALDELGPRERTVLKFRYLDGLSVNDIARLFQVHRVSASRWFATIQQSLFDKTRDKLATKLDLTESRVDSLLKLMTPSLEVSIERLLRKYSSGADAPCATSGPHQDHTDDLDTTDL